MKLSIKQQTFADYYIETGNAAESARRAGYSDKNAGANAAKTLKNPKIQEYIKNRVKEINDERKVNLDQAVLLLSDIANRKELKSHSRTVDNLAGITIKDMTYIFQPDVDQQTKALEHLIKIQGGFDNSSDNGTGEQVIFVNSGNEMLKYMEEHGDEYDNIDK